MNHRRLGRRADLHHAADITGRNDIGLFGFKGFDFAFFQLARNCWLQQVVRACGPTAQMAISRFNHIKARLFEQIFRCRFNLLSVLQRAGCMIRDPQVLLGIGF